MSKRLNQRKAKLQNKRKCLSLFAEQLPKGDGVDRSLIQWMLSLTPTQRLQILQHNIRSIMRLRRGKANRQKGKRRLPLLFTGNS